VKRRNERPELDGERAELLPDRTTLTAIEFGRKQISPTNASVGSPTSSNLPIGSPSSNNAILAPAAVTTVSGGFMPVIFTLMPSINIIVQKSDLDGLGLGHHDGAAAETPVNEGHPGPDAAPIDGDKAAPADDGGGWMDFLRWLFDR